MSKTDTTKDQYLALCGGIGGAKLALGLSQILGENLSVAVNTGDDFQHFGLHISPDIDTVIYTLANKNNRKLGWGIEGESWNFFETMKEFGQESWFQIGDKDLVTHIIRTQLLNEGKTLSQVTQFFASKYQLKTNIIPMSNDLVNTVVKLKDGPEIPFQHYFVREQCEPEVSGFRFKGIESASICPSLLGILNNPNLKGIIICPSNPYVSIDPILSLPEMRRILKNHKAPVIAISPIVNGDAIKGPTAKIMSELNTAVSPVSIAKHYGDFIDGYVLDARDVKCLDEIRELGFSAKLAQTVMQSLGDRVLLADSCIHFISQLQNKTGTVS